MVEVDKTTVLLFALVVLLVPFPLISIGTTEDTAVLWWLGVALTVAGGAIPPITRYAFPDAEDDDESGGDGSAESDGDHSGGNPDDGTNDGKNDDRERETDGNDDTGPATATATRPRSKSGSRETGGSGRRSSTRSTVAYSWPTSVDTVLSPVVRRQSR